MTIPIFYGPGVGGSPGQVTLAVRSAAQAEGQAQRATTSVTELEARLDRLALLTEALWTLLRERVGMTDEELLDRVREVDLSDGVLDGKVRHGSAPCPQCGRMLSHRHLRCIYCGAQARRAPFEEV
ncbi:MAG: hypothetical protein ACC662_07885 [Planctomycetota bacterium]